MEPKAGFDVITTENAKMKDVIRVARQIAPSEANILLTGESGTGKNLISQAIHSESSRRAGPFILVNCLALPETLVESELFGHEKGAFTDAYAQRKGSFEFADAGTLYMDEIGDMSHSAQGKILEAIETKHFRRVGGGEFIHSDVRIIAATNRNLNWKMEQGEFREDLYYRLNEVSLHLPPLRERREDIPQLLNHFIRVYGDVCGKPGLAISKSALEHLTRYNWPGNVRELRNVVQAACLLCDGKTLWLEHFPFEIRLKPEFQADAPEDHSVDQILKRHVLSVLQSSGWNKKKAAASLGVSRPRLDRYIKKFNLQK
jgi:transcriptional regulator with PAS, ATPase and Fis domain